MSIILKPWLLLISLSLCLSSLSISGTAGAQNAEAAQNGDRPEAMLIMDFSGSMWGAVNGAPKFEVLKDIIDRNFDEWSQSLNLGVLAYGHRRKGDCGDIELAFRPGEAQSRTMRNWMTSQVAVGKTPLGNSLVTASGYFNNKGQEANLIVLSDGIESCGVDPCQVIRDLQAKGAKMTAHVIGFDLNDRDANQIRCIADLTGGTYVGANRADQLVDGFRKAVETIAVKDDSAEKALRETLEKSLDALRETAEKLDAANQRAATALAGLAAADAEVASLKDELTTTQDELARLNSVVQKQDATIEELLAALKDCETEVARLTAMLDDAGATIISQAAALDLANQENEQLRSDLENGNGTLSEQNSKINDLTQELADARAAADAQAAALEAAKRKNDQLSSKLEDRDATIEGQDAKIDDLNQNLTDAKSSNALLTDESERLQARLDEALRNRQLTVSSLDFGAFHGTNEPVDIAALVAERDSYLATLQVLRQNLGFILDPLSQAQSIANSLPDEANPVVVPIELNEVLVLLAPGVEGELPDLQWTLRGTSEQSISSRNFGSGSRIPLPNVPGTYQLDLSLPGYQTAVTFENEPDNPSSRREALNIGRLKLELPNGQTGIFFATITDSEGTEVARRPIETVGTLYLQPGLYSIRSQMENSVDELEVQIYAGKETAVPMRF